MSDVYISTKITVYALSYQLYQIVSYHYIISYCIISYHILLYNVIFNVAPFLSQDQQSYYYLFSPLLIDIFF